MRTYDKENIREDMRREVKPYIDDPDFEPEKIRSKSIAAAGLCAWVINILLYVHSFYLISFSEVHFLLHLDFMKSIVKSNQNVKL